MDLIAVLFIATSLNLDLPPNLLASICYVESKHNTQVINKYDGHSHSYGICQIKLETARHLGFTGDEKSLMIPANNIYYAGKYLKYQIDRYNNITRGIVAYNRGNAKSLTKSAYSDKVISQWRNYNNE